MKNFKQLREQFLSKALRYESVNERVHYAFDTQKAAKTFQKKVDGMPINIVKAGIGKYYIVDLRPGTKQADQEKAAKIAVSIGLSESYIEEASFSSSLIKRAVKIAKDMSGNMTGAYKKIERMRRGLGDHPEVEAALRLANESVNEGTMAIGIKDRDPKERAKAKQQLVKMLKKDGNKKVGSKEGQKFDEVLDTYILSDDLLADEFANPKNKNMKIIDLLKKHSKRLSVNFSESIDEGIMKKMSQIQIKRKYGRVIKKALSKGSLELPADAEEALYMYAFDNGEIKTDDPDEFTDWLDDNLKDFA
jgi:hypothetical protein